MSVHVQQQQVPIVRQEVTITAAQTPIVIRYQAVRMAVQIQPFPAEVMYPAVVEVMYPAVTGPMHREMETELR